MKGIKLVFKYTIASLLCVITFVCLYFVFCNKILKQPYPTLFGMASAVVSTGSMSPTIKENEVIFTVKRSSYNVGDIIIFKDGLSTTTHRIIAISENGYITKGDANNSPDQNPVPQKNVYGKVVAHSIVFGHIIMFLQSPMGVVFIFFLIISIASIAFLIDKILHKKNNPPTDNSISEI